MFQQFYASNPLLFWPLVGLAIFVVSFTAVMLYVLIGLRDPNKVERLAALPFESESGTPVHTGDVSVAEGKV